MIYIKNYIIFIKHLYASLSASPSGGTYTDKNEMVFSGSVFMIISERFLEGCIICLAEIA